MTGTPPGGLRFALRADQGGVKIKIPYPDAGSYAVLADGVPVDYTPFDNAIGRYSPLTKALGCGENRFVAVQNELEFYLTPDCEITVKPRDAIMSSVRMEWTLEEFYASGGETAFVDRVASTLGIHPSRVKTIQIYEGSVVVNFFLVEELEEELAQRGAEEGDTEETGETEEALPEADLGPKRSLDEL